MGHFRWVIHFKKHKSAATPTIKYLRKFTSNLSLHVVFPVYSPDDGDRKRFVCVHIENEMTPYLPHLLMSCRISEQRSTNLFPATPTV